MYGMVHKHKHRGLGGAEVIKEYICVTATSESFDRNDGKEAHGESTGSTRSCSKLVLHSRVPHPSLCHALRRKGRHRLGREA